MRTPNQLTAERVRLVTDVTRLKTSLRRTREALQEKAAALAALDEECRRRGIALVIHQPGAGDIHGHRTRTDSLPHDAHE